MSKYSDPAPWTHERPDTRSAGSHRVTVIVGLIALLVGLLLGALIGFTLARPTVSAGNCPPPGVYEPHVYKGVSP